MSPWTLSAAPSAPAAACLPFLPPGSGGGSCPSGGADAPFVPMGASGGAEHIFVPASSACGPVGCAACITGSVGGLPEPGPGTQYCPGSRGAGGVCTAVPVFPSSP